MIVGLTGVIFDGSPRLVLVGGRRSTRPWVSGRWSKWRTSQFHACQVHSQSCYSYHHLFGLLVRYPASTCRFDHGFACPGTTWYTISDPYQILWLSLPLVLLDRRSFPLALATARDEQARSLGGCPQRLQGLYPLLVVVEDVPGSNVKLPRPQHLLQVWSVLHGAITTMRPWHGPQNGNCHGDIKP